MIKVSHGAKTDPFLELVNKELRTALGVAEKRNDELRLALKVAQREWDEAKAWKVEYCRQVAEKDEQLAEAHTLLFNAEADRDAALDEVAVLRARVGELATLLRTMGISA